MEQNLFFNYILRGLGFKAYCAGARVRKRELGVPVGDYMGWSHVVNIVTLESSAGLERYMVDVGFGGDGPTKPLLLALDNITRNLGMQEVKLDFENIASNVDPGQRLWAYKLRNKERDFWKACYCFTEVEFLPQDYEVMSYFVNNSPASWFTTMTIAVKMLLDEEGEHVVGKEMLTGTEVKRNTGGKTRLMRTCGTEEERVEALRDVFGLVLTEKKVQGIRGRAVGLLNQ